MSRHPMKITSTHLADGRELIYFDDDPGVLSGQVTRELVDHRDLPEPVTESEMRRDPLTGEWITYAAHRNNRTFMPPANENPLAPTTPGNLPTEIPADDYDVVVFENRFPSFSTRIAMPDVPTAETLLAEHRDSTDPLASILDILITLAAEAAYPYAQGMLVESLRRMGHDPELIAASEKAATLQNAALADLLGRAIQSGQVDPALDPAHTAGWLLTIVDARYLNAEPGHDPSAEMRRTALGYLNPGNPGNPGRPGSAATAHEKGTDHA